VQSCHDDIAQVLREFVGRLGFSFSHEGRYSWLPPHTLNRPQARWDSHCNLHPSSGHVLADVSFILRSAARSPGYAAALRDAKKRWYYYEDYPCPGYALCALSFETGSVRPGDKQFLCEDTHATFPQPGNHRATCFTNVYRKLSVVQCRYLSRMIMAAAGLHTVRIISGWIRAPHAKLDILS
jgi:hypothetical protein